MFKKKIVMSSNNMKIVNDEVKSRDTFPKFFKFIKDGRTWTVTEETIDNGTEWRRIISDAGDEEVLTMSTLKRDVDAKVITFFD